MPTTWYVRTDGHDTAAGTANTSDATTGAFATPGKAASVAGSGDTIYVKSGTYTLTTSTPGAGGPVLLPAAKCLMEGFDVTPGDMAGWPTINAGSQTGLAYILKAQGTYTNSANIVRNIKVDGNSGSGNVGIIDVVIVYPTNRFEYCKASNCATGFTVCGSLIGCIADTCDKGIVPSADGMMACINCVARNCTSDGFYYAGGGIFAQFVGCISYNNGGNGFGSGTGYGMSCQGCIAYNNTGDGFQMTAYNIGAWVNCISYKNGGYGFNSGTNTDFVINRCAAGANTSGAVSATLFGANPAMISLTADPFVNAAAGDFNLNTTAGGGAALTGVTITL